MAQGGARDGEAYVQRIHVRFTYRMNDLSEFMKTLLQRFTRWHNARTKRRGNLWEETFKSVVVEDGLASKTMAAYIDLNPVRADMVHDPAEYRWRSYGEALGATGRSGAKAKAGLVRAIMADKGVEADARQGGRRGGCFMERPGSESWNPIAGEAVNDSEGRDQISDLIISNCQMH